MSEQTEDIKIFRIATTKNYADEFDYPVISYFTRSIRNLVLLHADLAEVALSEIYFGTNESLRFSVSEFRKIVENAEEITTEQYKSEIKLYKCISDASVDIIDTVIDNICYSLRQTNKNLLLNIETTLENSRSQLWSVSQDD